MTIPGKGIGIALVVTGTNTDKVMALYIAGTVVGLVGVYLYFKK